MVKRGQPDPSGRHAPADDAILLKDFDIAAGTTKRAGTCQARQTRSDDRDPLRHLAFVAPLGRPAFRKVSVRSGVILSDSTHLNT